MGKRRRFEDPRDAAQFHSLYQVIVHATPGDTPKEKRLALMDEKRGEAYLSMVKTKRWGDYRMVFNAKGQHVGFGIARAKDWFMLPEGGHRDDAEGPFRSKKLILSRLGVKTSKVRGPGSYMAAGHTLFTRDAADSIIPGMEATLP